MFERMTVWGRWPLALMLPALIALVIALPAGQTRTSAPESELVSVIVQTTGDAEAAASAIESAGGVIDRTFTLIPAVEARVPADGIATLEAEAGIGFITPNAPVLSTAKPDKGDGGGSDKIASVYTHVIDADVAHAQGITGAGIGIAVVDTGLTDDPNTDFGDRVTHRVAFAGEAGNDLYGHGTHVAGIAAGDGNEQGKKFLGVAPGANLISVKIGTPDSANVADLMAGLEWIHDNHETHNIRVVNISLSSSTPMSYRKDPLDAAVEALWFDGVVVVASAGNRGTDPYAVDYAPGNDPFVISVGGYSDNWTKSTNDDFLKDWSSRGVSHDGIAKPEIVAPGWRLIASAGSADSVLYQSYPDNQVGSHYLYLSGTSVAAPVVSGTVALMLEANPALTPDEVKALLIATSQPVAGSTVGGVMADLAVDAAASGDSLPNPNAGFLPSLWIDASTGDIDPYQIDGVTWDGVTWDGVTWDGVTWDGVTWDGVTWDGVTWDGVTWDGVTWDSIDD